MMRNVIVPTSAGPVLGSSLDRLDDSRYDRKTTKAIEREQAKSDLELWRYEQRVQTQTAKDVIDLHRRAFMVELEIRVNSAIAESTASGEMQIADRLRMRAGSSLVNQEFVADRLNSLMQRNDRTLRKWGF